MRIISGRFKGFKLSPVHGKHTRPSTDFIRETIFNILQDCEGTDVLDLFAGSGALGLEALSRGAERVTMVDIASQAIVTQRKNLDRLGCSEQCRIVKRKAATFLRECGEVFDLILIDPPYDRGLIDPALQLIFGGGILKESGRVVVEHSRNEPLKAEWSGHVVFSRRYGETVVSVLSIPETMSEINEEMDDEDNEDF